MALSQRIFLVNHQIPEIHSNFCERIRDVDHEYNIIPNQPLFHSGIVIY